LLTELQQPFSQQAEHGGKMFPQTLIQQTTRRHTPENSVRDLYTTMTLLVTLVRNNDGAD
jgi:hypothetical protein